MTGADKRAPSQTLRLTELLASVSLATDLGTGQPPGHALRTCSIATALAESMGCGLDKVRTVHQFALLRFVGCTSDAAETAAMVGGDDRAINAAMAPVLMGSGRQMMGRFVRSVGPGQPPLQRLRLLAGALADPNGTERSLSTHCEVAVMLAGRARGLEQPVVDALAHAYERWDGKGHPARMEGDAIPLAVRIALVARDADLAAYVPPLSRQSAGAVVGLTCTPLGGPGSSVRIAYVPAGKEAPMAGVEVGDFNAPDETRTPDKTTIEIVRMGGTTASRMRLEPGWKWSECIKPIVGGESCQMLHLGLLQSGTMGVVHDDGTEQEIGPGQTYVIEPGHDAWVVGDEPVTGFEFQPQTAEEFARG